MTHTDDARLADVLAAVVEDGDTKALFRRLLEDALQELIEAELTAVIGAAGNTDCCRTRLDHHDSEVSQP